MKRHGNLFERIISLDNLYLAEKRARKGKSKKKEIIDYIADLDDNIMKLHYSLRYKTYEVSDYHHFIIYEPKQRKISKLPYVDRIVHHAVINVIGSIIINSLISQTYSCIKGRGIHKGLKTLNKYLKNKEETKYCLKLDIQKYYPSIPNDKLKQLFRTKFKDNDLLNLLDLIIDSHLGCPLGNYTSQFFANFYLNKFCHWLKENKKIKYLSIYCDDIIILHSSKEFLHNLKKEIKEYLCNLSLILGKYQVFPVDSRGIDYLGYISYSTHIRLRKRIKKNYIRMITKYPNRKSLVSYKGWILHCNGVNLQKKYNNKLKQQNDKNKEKRVSKTLSNRL